jgi:hypothetical protein
MDTMLQALLSWQFLLFCLAIAAIVFVLRTIAEYVMKNWAFAARESSLWNDLLLPILPVLLGTGLAFFVKKYPYPEGLMSISGRMIWGLVAGLASGLVYRLFKTFLMGKVGELISKMGEVISKANPKPTDETTVTPPEDDKQ